MRLRPVRHLGARSLVGLLAAGLLLSASPALAGGGPTPPVEGSTGKTGDFGFIESELDPAGVCHYGYEPDGSYYNGIRKINVDPPRAYARAGRVTQRISTRIVIQAWDFDHWLRYAATTWQSRIATPTQAGDFTRRGLVIDSYPHHNDWGAYRAKVKLRWFARNGTTVVGRAWIFPDYYRSTEGTVPVWVQELRCGGTTG